MWMGGLLIILGDTLSPNVGRVTLSSPPHPHRRFPFSFLLPASRRGCPSAAPGKCGSDPALGSRTRIPRSLRTSSRGVMMAWPLRCNGSRAHFPGVCLWNTGRSPSPEGPGRRGLSGQCPSLEPEAPAEIEGGVPVDAPQPLLSPGSEGTRVAAGVQLQRKRKGPSPHGPGAAASRHGAASCPLSCGVSPGALSGHGDGGPRRGWTGGYCL